MRSLIALTLITNLSFAQSFSKPKESFELVKEMLLKKYYQKGISEEELYAAAVKGMVENLDPKMAEWDKMLSPQEAAERMNDVDGKLVGAGMEIKLGDPAGLVEVTHVIPGTPAKNSDVRAGDLLLSIDGKTTKGRTLQDIVYSIRGKVGQKRKLSLLREDKVLSKVLILEQVPYANVSHQMLPNQTGLLTINYFTGDAPKKVKEALSEMKSIKHLVIDLRGNTGGMFDSATDTASLFLKKGQTISRVSRRDLPEEIISAKNDAVLDGVPIVILVNEDTSSGAELFSAVLKENVQAQLVGTHTHGKWSMQTLEVLPNKYAVKFTVGTFSSPSGKSYPGTGISPDIEVTSPRQQVSTLQRMDDVQKRLAEDAPLRTALHLVQKS